MRTCDTFRAQRFTCDSFPRTAAIFFRLLLLLFFFASSSSFCFPRSSASRFFFYCVWIDWFANPCRGRRVWIRMVTLYSFSYRVLPVFHLRLQRHVSTILVRCSPTQFAHRRRSSKNSIDDKKKPEKEERKGKNWKENLKKNPVVYGPSPVESSHWIQRITSSMRSYTENVHVLLCVIVSSLVSIHRTRSMKCIFHYSATA